LDTNVLISAALFKTSIPGQVVRHVFSMAVPVWSSATYAELESRLWRPKFDCYASLEDRRAYLIEARSVGMWVDIPTHLAAQRHSRDPNDDAFVHAALAAKAAWLVTGDQDLLTLPPLGGLAILTPAQAQALNPASPPTL
jgi:putative PIN family toxin of toxin-antitoxin system